MITVFTGDRWNASDTELAVYLAVQVLQNVCVLKLVSFSYQKMIRSQKFLLPTKVSFSYQKMINFLRVGLLASSESVDPERGLLSRYLLTRCKFNLELYKNVWKCVSHFEMQQQLTQPEGPRFFKYVYGLILIQHADSFSEPLNVGGKLSISYTVSRTIWMLPWPTSKH